MFTGDEIRELAELNALITHALAPESSIETKTALRKKLDALRQSTEEDASNRGSLDEVIAHLSRLLFNATVETTVPKQIQEDAGLTALHNALLSIRRFVMALSSGDLSQELNVRGYWAGALKSLQANLRHLTWQTQQIAAGDYSQRVDFMGEFASAFNTMTSKLRETVGALHDKQNELRKVIAALDKEIVEHKEALSRVRQLQGLLPICSYCKKIRDDQNYWQQVEGYISHHSEAQFSHGICPDCYKKVAKEWGVPERPIE